MAAAHGLPSLDSSRNQTGATTSPSLVQPRILDKRPKRPSISHKTNPKKGHDSKNSKEESGTDYSPRITVEYIPQRAPNPLSQSWHAGVANPSLDSAMKGKKIVSDSDQNNHSAEPNMKGIVDDLLAHNKLLTERVAQLEKENQELRRKANNSQETPSRTLEIQCALGSANPDLFDSKWGSALNKNLKKNAKESSSDDAKSPHSSALHADRVPDGLRGGANSKTGYHSRHRSASEADTPVASHVIGQNKYGRVISAAEFQAQPRGTAPAQTNGGGADLRTSAPSVMAGANQGLNPPRASASTFAPPKQSSHPDSKSAGNPPQADMNRDSSPKLDSITQNPTASTGSKPKESNCCWNWACWFSPPNPNAYAVGTAPAQVTPKPGRSPRIGFANPTHASNK